MSLLSNKTIAILTDHGFEEVELTSPKEALEAEGATVHIISLQDKVKGWNHDHWSIYLDTDVNLVDANPENYDAILIPGGVMNPDEMRKHKEYINFAAAFFESGKPIAAICHAPQLLIETGMLHNHKLTSYPSIKTDLVNAGAIWVDEEVVTDDGLVTSRSPKDLPAFNKKIIEELAKGIHSNRNAYFPLY